MLKKILLIITLALNSSAQGMFKKPPQTLTSKMIPQKNYLPQQRAYNTKKNEQEYLSSFEQDPFAEWHYQPSHNSFITTPTIGALCAGGLMLGQILSKIYEESKLTQNKREITEMLRKKIYLILADLIGTQNPLTTESKIFLKICVWNQDINFCNLIEDLQKICFHHVLGPEVVFQQLSSLHNYYLDKKNAQSLLLDNNPDIYHLIFTHKSLQALTTKMIVSLILDAQKNNKYIEFSRNFFSNSNSFFTALTSEQQIEILRAIQDKKTLGTILKEYHHSLRNEVSFLLKQHIQSKATYDPEELPSYHE